MFSGRPLSAPTVSERGFIDGRLFLFPQKSPNDTTQVVGDGLIREEVFLKPAEWFQFAAGVDFNASSHDEVEDEWRLDFCDRGILRPRLAVVRRRHVAKGPLTVTLGKQVIRWARADVLNPTDRFAARDYVNPLNPDLLPVLGVRPALQLGRETFEVVWVPRLRRAAMPLLDQRWTVVPLRPPRFRSSTPVRRSLRVPKPKVPLGPRGHPRRVLGLVLQRVQSPPEHRPVHDVQRGTRGTQREDQTPRSPRVILVDRGTVASTLPLRTYGADAAVPTRWFTIKGEAAYFTSSSPVSDEYVLYVLQIERQTVNRVMVGGYAGEVGDRPPCRADVRARPRHDAVARRASAYTIDSNRTVTFRRPCVRTATASMRRPNTRRPAASAGARR